MTMNWTTNLLMNTIDFYILNKYNRVFSKKRRLPNKYNVLLFFLLVIISCVINQVTYATSYSLVNLLVNMGLIFLFSLSYIMPTVYCVVLTGIYIGFGFVAELISYMMFSYYVDFLPDRLKYPVTVFICEIIRYLFVLLVSKAKKIKMPKLDIRTSFMLTIIPILSVAVCCIAMNLIRSDKKQVVDLLCICLIVLMFSINIMFWMIYQKLMKSISDAHESQMILQDAEAKEQYYREIENYNNEIRMLRHDMKNRLLALKTLSNNSEIIDEEIQRFIKELEPANKKIYTSNVVINTIINSKQKYFEENNINIEISVIVPEKINIDYSDAGILLGNLIDNAIEGCKKVEGERYIHIKLLYKQGILIIKIVNAKNSAKVDLTKSSKEDKINHGMGIKSVKKIVNKYSGAIEFMDLGNEFEVDACLYNIQTE